MSEALCRLMELQGALLLAAADLRCFGNPVQMAAILQVTVRWGQDGKMTWLCNSMCLAAAFCDFLSEASVKLLFVLGECWDTLAAALQRKGGIGSRKIT